MVATRLSGIQKDVLSLYRKILRGAVRKDRSTLASEKEQSFVSLRFNKSSTTSYAAAEFRKQAATAKRSNFKQIEYMIRKGEKQLKLMQMPGVKVVGGTS